VAPVVERESPKRPSDKTLKRLEKLKNWRKKLAQELGVESDIVLPKIYLNTLAEHPPKSLQELESVMHDSPSRFRTYGEQLYRLVGV
jgi:ribonuclease D